MRYYEYMLQKGREMDNKVKPKVGSTWVSKVNFPEGADVEMGGKVEVVRTPSKAVEYKNLDKNEGILWIAAEVNWHYYFMPILDDIFSPHKQRGYQNNVDKPSHYNNSSIEAIEYIKDSLGLEGFSYHCEGTVKKYLHRFRYKGKPTEDLKKARQYLDWLIETEEESNDD